MAIREVVVAVAGGVMQSRTDLGMLIFSDVSEEGGYLVWKHGKSSFRYRGDYLLHVNLRLNGEFTVGMEPGDSFDSKLLALSRWRKVIHQNQDDNFVLVLMVEAATKMPHEHIGLDVFKLKLKFVG